MVMLRTRRCFAQNLKKKKHFPVYELCCVSCLSFQYDSLHWIAIGRQHISIAFEWHFREQGAVFRAQRISQDTWTRTYGWLISVYRSWTRSRFCYSIAVRMLKMFVVRFVRLKHESNNNCHSVWRVAFGLLMNKPNGNDDERLINKNRKIAVYNMSANTMNSILFSLILKNKFSTGWNFISDSKFHGKRPNCADHINHINHIGHAFNVSFAVCCLFLLSPLLVAWIQ